MPDADAFALHRPELADALRHGDEKIARLLAPTAKTFAAGQTVIEQGTRHDWVYRLRSGWAGRVRTLPDGRNQIILVFLPGDLFAVTSMFLTEHGDAVQALSAVEVERIDQRTLKAAFDGDADIATRCVFQVVEEERRLHNWITALGQGDAAERMAHMLLEFRGRLIRAGVLSQGDAEFGLPMTQEQMGEMLGITTVHVNRVLKDLREKGMVAVKGGTVRLLDPAALEGVAFAVQDPYERRAPEHGGEGAGP